MLLALLRPFRLRSHSVPGAAKFDNMPCSSLRTCQHLLPAPSLRLHHGVSEMHKRTGITLSICIVGILAFATSEAYQFVPTDAEWSAWPAHCKAKYVWTNIGMTSKFAKAVGAVEKAELAKWENDGIEGLHHYCAGTIYVSRAMAARNEGERHFNLNNALEETQFTLNTSNERSPLYSHLATQMARILYEQERFDDALHILSSAVEAQPLNSVLYSAIAVMQRKLGNLDDAKETLLRGNDVLNGQSAEIHYNLGLISLELGEIDAAVKYAESAYSLGYPLPGLRAKLKGLGRM